MSSSKIAKLHKRKTQKRTLDTREAIKHAGAELFATRGYRETGVRDIAELAGCNQALVSYHFKGKAGLYDAVLTEAMREFIAIAGEDVPAHQQPVRALIKGFAAALGASEHLGSMLMREYMQPDRLLNAESGAILRQSMGLTERMIASLPQDSPAHSLDPQTIHLTIVGPLLLFQIAAPVRESIARNDPTVSAPTLEQFADHLADLLEPAIA